LRHLDASALQILVALQEGLRAKGKTLAAKLPLVPFAIGR
jgi:hypothetical protein